jgi:hypothetical protein
MKMVAADKSSNSIELDVALKDFESFLKAFLPRWGELGAPFMG